jgi:hypothetical protein
MAKVSDQKYAESLALIIVSAINCLLLIRLHHGCLCFARHKKTLISGRWLNGCACRYSKTQVPRPTANVP